MDVLEMNSINRVVIDPMRSSYFISNLVGIILIFISIFLLFNSNFEITSDGLVRYEALMLIINSGEIPSIKFSLVGPLFSIPLYYLGIDLKYFNAFLFVMTNVYAFVLMSKSFKFDFVVKFILITLSASMFTAHTKDFFFETFSACFLFLGILHLVIGKRWYIPTFFISFAVANSSILLIPVSLFCIFFFFKTKKIHFLMIIFASLMLILLENYVKFGSVFNVGYSDDKGVKTLMPYSGMPNFSYPLFFGLLSTLFSFGKGLMFFTPAIFIGLETSNKSYKTTYYLLSTVTVSLIFLYSTWWAWYGGITWGPRFYLIVSFLNSFVLAFYLTKDSIKLKPIKSFFIVMALIMSIWVGFNGHIFDYTWFSIAHKDNYIWEPLHWYTPEFSILWYPFVFTDFLSNKYNLNLLFFYISIFLYLTFSFLSSQVSFLFQILKGFICKK